MDKAVAVVVAVLTVVLTVDVEVAGGMVWGIDITHLTEFDGFACSELDFFLVLRYKNEVERKKIKNVRLDTVSAKRKLVFKNSK